MIGLWSDISNSMTIKEDGQYPQFSVDVNDLNVFPILQFNIPNWPIQSVWFQDELIPTHDWLDQEFAQVFSDG